MRAPGGMMRGGAMDVFKNDPFFSDMGGFGGGFDDIHQRMNKIMQNSRKM